jgi:hypothetical protein
MHDVGHLLLYLIYIDHTVECKLIITAPGRDLTILWDVT